MMDDEHINGMTHEEFERCVLLTPRQELGLCGFVRLLRKFRARSDDYTRDRRLWLDGVTLEEVLAELPPVDADV